MPIPAGWDPGLSRPLPPAPAGGAVTPEVDAELRQARRRGQLCIAEHCQVERARWLGNPGEGGSWRSHGRGVDALGVKGIWLATGRKLGVSQQPLLRPLHQQRPIPLVHDHPVLENDPRRPGTGVPVTGGLASLQLGPAARNRFGGREAARASPGRSSRADRRHPPGKRAYGAGWALSARTPQLLHPPTAAVLRTLVPGLSTPSTPGGTGLPCSAARTEPDLATQLGAGAPGCQQMAGRRLPCEHHPHP